MIFALECTVSSVIACTQSSHCEGDMNQKTLEDVIKTVRVSVVADVCGVSQEQSTNGWITENCLAQNIPAKQITLKKSLMHQTDYFLLM